MCRSLVRSLSLRIWLVAVVLLSPSAALRAQERAGAGEAAQEPDLRFATPESFAGMVARPRRVLTAPEMALLPYEVFQAVGRQEFGIDPLNIEEVRVFFEPPAFGPPQFLAILRFAEPFAIDQLTEQLTGHTEREELDGRPYLRSKTFEPSLFAPDEKTLLIGTDAMLRRAYEGREEIASSSLTERLQRLGNEADAAAAVEFAPIRPLVTAQLQQLPPLPPAFEAFRNVPHLVEAAEWKLDVTGQMDFGMTIYATDEQAADELEVLVLHGLDLWQQQMLAQLAQAEQSEDAIERAMAQYTRRVSGNVKEIYRPVRDGERLVFFGDESGESSEQTQQLYQVAIIGILVALLLPAVQAAREAARRRQAGHIRQLMLSLLIYEETHGHFPPHASYSEDGKPLLSWRVHILPYMGEKQLYSQFRLDEPWDSEHNRQLIERMPRFFADPSSPRAAAEHRSSYVAPYGEGLFMEGRDGIRIGDVKDGTSRTLALVEVDDQHAPIWTKPQDMDVDLKNPLAGLGGNHPGKILAVLVDGSTRSIAEDIDPAALRAMFTRAAGD